MGKNILFIGVYGVEMVECGGAMAINARKGGRSFVSLMLTTKASQENVKAAAEALGIEKVYFNEFKHGEVACDHAHKVALIKIIRETKPDVIITQDPEHCVSDLDPDRRPAMTLILESIALASRNTFAVDELAGYEPHPIANIYYMRPLNANCTVNVAEVWDLKQKGLDALEQQMEFSAKHYERKLSPKEIAILVPEFSESDSYYKKGRLIHGAVDKATHMHYGLGSHGKFVLAEPYRYEGIFELHELL